MPVYRKPGRGPETWRVILGSRTTRQEWIVHGSKKEAETFEARKKLERATAGEGPRQTRAAYDFATFCVERYWPHAKKHLRASTLSVRKYQLDTLARFFGKHRLTAITTDAIERYKEWRADTYEDEHGKPIVASTVNTELTKLQAVLTYAHHLGIPCARPKVIPLPQIGKRRVRVWTEEQVTALLVAAERLAPQLLPILVCMANTGCRPGEAIAARRSWVDVSRRQLRIEPSEVWQPKDNEPREILISDTLWPFIARGESEFLFTNTDGEPWRTFPDATFNMVRNAAGHADTCGRWVRPPMGPKRGGKHDAAILDFVAAHPGASASDIAAAIDAHVDAVKSALRRFRKRGQVDASGTTRDTVRAVQPAAPGVTPGECTCGATGLRGGPYTLRHTFASTFLQRSPDMPALARIMGHDHTRVTEMYFHMLPDHLEATRNVVNFAPRIGPARVDAAKRWGVGG